MSDPDYDVVPVSYVVGFLFDDVLQRIVLIRKIKPVWQSGLLNGVGGKVEDSDPDPASAMFREFLEETGAVVVDWELFQIERFGTGATVYFYYALSSKSLEKVKTMTEEEIVTLPLAGLPWDKMMPNLAYLIPMAMTKHARIEKDNWPIL